MSDDDKEFNEFAEKNGAPMTVTGGPIHQYQLYCDNSIPCRWHLSVDGDKKHPIKTCALNVQSRWRDWHLEYQYEPPPSEKIHVFEMMIQELFARRIQLGETLPFLQTDAAQLENLAQFLDYRISTALRSKGQDFLDGRAGDTVRMRLDLGRVYFKWQELKRFYERVHNMREADLEAVKLFIADNGGYVDEHGGRGWYRCRYWVKLDIFDARTIKRWTSLEEEKEEEDE